MYILNEELFRIEHPLGPVTTPRELQDLENKSIFQDFFDSENFLSESILELHPNAVLGRRGSGKTAILFHLQFNGGYTVISALESAKSFTSVAGEIEKRLGGPSAAAAEFVENSAEIWEAIILTTVISQTFETFQNDSRYHDSDEVAEIREFLQLNGLINIRLYSRVWQIIVQIFEKTAKAKYNMGEDFDFFVDFLNGVFREDKKFNSTWKATVRLLNKAGARALVLIDSLEQFPVHRFEMKKAIGGLLHFIGELDRSFAPIKVCMCFPAELHEEFSSFSENPRKDFEKIITLHWDSDELFRLCGHRLDYSLRTVPRDFGRILPLEERPSRQQTWDYWHQILPQRVKNRYGLKEETIPYILRHTQLLPSHILEILNSILGLALKGRRPPFRVTEAEVVGGVRLAEKVICDSIVNGFLQKYPFAQQLISLIIPHLPNQFRFEELEKVNEKFGFGVEKDSTELLEMFVRMGIVGRYEAGSSKRYDDYRFDYTYNGQMPYRFDDYFGIHPAFSGQHKQLSRTPEGTLPVYPIEKFTGKRPGVGRPNFT